MSAFDPTIHPDDVERRLRSWMAEQRPGVDLTSTYGSIVEQTSSSEQRPSFLVRPSVRRAAPPPVWSYRSSRLIPIAVAALLLGLAIGAGILAGRQADHAELRPSFVPSVVPSLVARPTPAPPSSAPASSPPASADPSIPSSAGNVVDPAKDYETSSSLLAGERVTSGRFLPKVTFTVTPRQAGAAAGDICPLGYTSPRMIVLAHPHSCVEDLRFIRPWAVDCGAAGEHPDADALAAAILAIPGIPASVDLGDLAAGADVPAGTFREPYHGHVVRMSYRPLTRDSELDDPDHCRLLPEPGSSDPAIEIRHDINALFIMLDVDGELVVVRTSSMGHDKSSRRGAVAFGYSADDDELLHLLRLVRDIRFGP